MEVKAGQHYQHYKGSEYAVLHVALDATNEREGKQVVVYQSKDDDKVWCRDLSEFTEVIDWPSGERRPRFVLRE